MAGVLWAGAWATGAIASWWLLDVQAHEKDRVTCITAIVCSLLWFVFYPLFLVSLMIVRKER